MKNLLILTLLLFACIAQAQENGTPAEVFQITGLVQQERSFSLEDLRQFPVQKIGKVKITSHNGEPRGELRKLKGVLLKDILEKTGIKSENPRILSEYYIVCEASDGYKNVYSWNELFNTSVGNGVYIVTEMEGNSMVNNDRNIMMISPEDFRTGRRNLKWLYKINVKRLE